jgi:hypothetical protein
MRGDPKVIENLNRGVRSELTAMNQYWPHYRLLDNWGYAILVNCRCKLLGLVCDNAGPLAKTSLRQSASTSRRWRSFNGPIRGRERPKA